MSEEVPLSLRDELRFKKNKDCVDSVYNFITVTRLESIQDIFNTKNSRISLINSDYANYFKKIYLALITIIHPDKNITYAPETYPGEMMSLLKDSIDTINELDCHKVFYEAMNYDGGLDYWYGTKSGTSDEAQSSAQSSSVGPRQRRQPNDSSASSEVVLAGNSDDIIFYYGGIIFDFLDANEDLMQEIIPLPNTKDERYFDEIAEIIYRLIGAPKYESRSIISSTREDPFSELREAIGVINHYNEEGYEIFGDLMNHYLSYFTKYDIPTKLKKLRERKEMRRQQFIEQTKHKPLPTVFKSKKESEKEFLDDHLAQLVKYNEDNEFEKRINSLIKFQESENNIKAGIAKVEEYKQEETKQEETKQEKTKQEETCSLVIQEILSDVSLLNLYTTSKISRLSSNIDKTYIRNVKTLVLNDVNVRGSTLRDKMRINFQFIENNGCIGLLAQVLRTNFSLKKRSAGGTKKKKLVKCKTHKKRRHARHTMRKRSKRCKKSKRRISKNR